VDAFVDFYLQKAADLVGEVGYVKLPAELYAKVTKNWDARRTGTQFLTPAGEPVTGALAQVYE
jgi:hypothetical protein